MNTKANGNKDNVINSPMAQLAKLYEGIEAVLRRAATEVNFIPVKRVFDDELVTKYAKSEVQVRGIINTLVSKDYVLSEKKNNLLGFMWNLKAPPFTFQIRKARGSALRQPSKPKVVKLPPQPKPPKANQSYQFYMDEIARVKAEYANHVRERARVEPQTMEVEFEGAVVTIGRDPETGRIRVKVRDVLAGTL